jgi:hypothetical protein
MSRLDDLIDLIRTTNEVYFITAPGRVRAAYILVDDIVELALKTYLQERALEQRKTCQANLEAVGIVTSNNHRNALGRYYEEDIDIPELSNALGRGVAGIPLIETELNKFPLIQHWSANNPDARDTFDSIVNEIKPFFPFALGAPPHSTIALLDEALSRHKIRNKFYHDHHQTGLTIDDDKCLTALCSMYDLLSALYPNFHANLQQAKYKIIRCQIGVLRLKLAAHGAQDLKDPYNRALEQFAKGLQVKKWSENFEHSVLHTISEDFFIALRQQLRESVAQRQRRVDKINQMRNPNVAQRAEAEIAQRTMISLSQQLADIEALMS